MCEQFFAGVRLGNEAAQAARQHIAQFVLLAKAAAQDYGDIRVQRIKLVENRVTVHNGKKKIKDDQANFLADLLVDLERFETVAGEDYLITFVGQHRCGQFGNLVFILHDENQLAITSLIQDFNVGWN